MTRPPWGVADYRFAFDADPTAAVWPRLFAAVWRVATDRPGFAMVAFDDEPSSTELRSRLLTVATALTLCQRPRHFWPERLGRFDQQVTTKFHRDGAPEESLLTLGYEASTVRSRFFVADACRAAEDARQPVADFLRDHNPMQPDGVRRLAPYTTELDLPANRAFIVVLNNSLLPTDAAPPHLLGVLHKGEIPTPDPGARRVINSIGWALIDRTSAVTPAMVADYVNRETLD